MFIDLHCHLDILEDIEEKVQNAKKAGVTKVLASGLNPESNRKVLELSEKYDNVFPACGIYPIDAMNTETNTTHEIDIDAEIEFIKKNSDRILAIGEVGLDYHTGNPDNGQRKLFRKMIELAIELDKPIIIHSRKAEQEVVEILEEYDYKKIIIHCFCGKKKLMLRIKNNGWFFTVPTSVVRATQFQDMVKEVNISQLFCETDSPFLTPFKEGYNEPAFVVESYKKIAEIKNMDVEEVKNNIFMNFQKLFL